jgi:hypothetical protein
MENTTHSEELHWGWLLGFFLLLVVLLFAFGDVLTAIIGILVMSITFASYSNSLHSEH